MSELLRALPGLGSCVAVLRQFTYGPGMSPLETRR